MRERLIAVLMGNIWPSSLAGAPPSPGIEDTFNSGERLIRSNDTRDGLDEAVAHFHLHSAEAMANSFALVVLLVEGRSSSASSPSAP